LGDGAVTVGVDVAGFVALNYFVLKRG